MSCQSKVRKTRGKAQAGVYGEVEGMSSEGQGQGIYMVHEGIDSLNTLPAGSEKLDSTITGIADWWFQVCEYGDKGERARANAAFQTITNKQYAQRVIAHYAKKLEEDVMRKHGFILGET